MSVDAAADLIFSPSERRSAAPAGDSASTERSANAAIPARILDMDLSSAVAPCLINVTAETDVSPAWRFAPRGDSARHPPAALTRHNHRSARPRLRGQPRDAVALGERARPVIRVRTRIDIEVVRARPDQPPIGWMDGNSHRRAAHAP